MYYSVFSYWEMFHKCSVIPEISVCHVLNTQYTSLGYYNLRNASTYVTRSVKSGQIHIQPTIFCTQM